jgi:hypothetical protein
MIYRRHCDFPVRYVKEPEVAEEALPVVPRKAVAEVSKIGNL